MSACDATTFLSSSAETRSKSRTARSRLAVLDLDLVSTGDDRNVVASYADPSEASMPARNILVGITRRYLEHDDDTLCISVSSHHGGRAKVLLSSSVPHIELDWTVYSTTEFVWKVKGNGDGGVGKRKDFVRQVSPSWSSIRKEVR